MAKGGTPIVVPIITDLSRLKSGLKSASRTIGGFSKSAGGALAGFSLAAAGTVGKSVLEFSHLDESVREVGTLLGNVSDTDLRGLRDSVRDVSKAFGQGVEEVSKAFYDALSSTVADASTVEPFVRAAGKLSKAGATEIGAGVDLLTSALNAFKLSASDAERVSDVLFATVKSGKTTIPEIAEGFSNIGPAAAAAGISIEEAMGWLAQLTLAGTPTAQAATQIKSSLAEIVRPGTKLSNTFEEAAGKSFRDFISEGGSLIDAMALIGKHSEESGKSVFEMASKINAVQAILGATGKNSDSFVKSLSAVADAAGSTDVAFSIMAGSSRFTLDKLSAGFKDIQYAIAEWAMPSLEKFVAWATKNFPKFERAFNKIRRAIISGAKVIKRVLWPVLKPIAKLLIAAGKGIAYVVNNWNDLVSRFQSARKRLGWLDPMLAGLATLLGVVLVKAITALTLVLVSKLSVAVIAVGLKVLTFGAAISAIFAPITLVTLAIGALVAGIVWLWKNNETFKNVVLAVWGAFKAIVMAVVNYFKNDFLADWRLVWDTAKSTITTIVNVLKAIFTGYVKFWRATWDTIKTVFRAIWDWINEKISGVKAAVESVISNIRQYFTGLIDFFKGVFSGNWEQAWDGMVAVFKGAFGLIKNLIWDIPKALLGMLTSIGADIFEGIKSLGAKLANFIWEGLKFAFEFQFVTLPKLLLEWVPKILTGLLDLGGKLVGHIWNGLVASFKFLFMDLPKTILTWLVNIASKLMNLGKDIGSHIIEGIVYFVKRAASAIGGALKEAFTKGLEVVKDIPIIGGAFEAIGNVIPGFAKGGIVTQPTIGMIGEAGPEAIIPLDKLGHLGSPIIHNHINVYGGLDTADDIWERIESGLTERQRIKGRLDFVDAG